MPGVLPVLNRRAVELAIRMALYTGGEVQRASYFARKNYFYPDLPKGYQISMFEHPLIRGGQIELDTSMGSKTIRLNRIHLEEDAGKLIHEEGRTESYFDVNRCGVPLIEIVTEPDFETIEEVTLFLTTLKEMLIFAHASLGNMEEGNIRVDTNISIRPEGQKELGTRAEIKNMNSFVNVIAAIKLEIERQTGILERGGAVVLETLLYDPVQNTVSAMRSKEEAHDYRYFPEPDLVPVVVDDEWIARIRAELPELRSDMRARFERDYGILAYDAEILTVTPYVAAYYEDVIHAGANPKEAANWVNGEVLRILKETHTDIRDFKATPPMLASLLGMVGGGVVSGLMAKTVFDEVAATGKDPNEIVEEKGLSQISDAGALREAARKVMEANPAEVARYRAGKTRLLGFFVGEVMKATRGKANPREVNAILLEMLS
jgi:aspartyl-tRNA(Asn)/glutamyl-tRNA(Gln) amidotransferase subunit B